MTPFVQFKHLVTFYLNTSVTFRHAAVTAVLVLCAHLEENVEIEILSDLVNDSIDTMHHELSFYNRVCWHICRLAEKTRYP